jgi:flavodoxin
MTMKTCIIFHSYSGVTRGVAEKLAAATGGDLIEVSPKTPYSKLTAYTVGCLRARKGNCDPVDRETIDVSAYDLVVVGTPVWAFRATPVVNGAVSALSGCSGKKAVVFATCGGSAGETVPELKKALEAKGVRVSGTMVLNKDEVKDDQKLAQLADLLKAAETVN